MLRQAHVNGCFCLLGKEADGFNHAFQLLCLLSFHFLLCIFIIAIRNKIGYLEN